MGERDRVATVPLRPIEEGNAVFRRAVGCIELLPPLAAHLLRDRLETSGIDIRTVTPPDLQSVLAALEESIRVLGGDARALASIAALRQLR